MSDKKTELVSVLSKLMDEVIRLRKPVTSLDDVFDNFDKLIATMLTVRDVAKEIAELPGMDRTTWVTMCVLQDSMTREILRLTHYEAKSAVAGV